MTTGHVLGGSLPVELTFWSNSRRVGTSAGAVAQLGRNPGQTAMTPVSPLWLAVGATTRAHRQSARDLRSRQALQADTTWQRKVISTGHLRVV